ncbi:ATP-binding SpoIIE family protein phosphatase [Saccharothrix syringae]|uniref:Transcriptional regulator n=1 Tax=Saccharothrix syringae TaxID=103733 RepID=A0A5Q0GWJ3_SACSY|nr:ATP-binding SpoIIE family protein phosphatase [Saccharothrix syringae]QFZ18263.1 transcriptional regulator [Saccharothrix syringae]
MEAVSTCLPVAEDVAWLNVDEAAEVGRVRRTATHLAERLAFPGTRVAEVALAVTEIGTNLHKHATGGQVVVRSVRDAERAAVEVLALDRGPGITDVGLAMTDGQSTTGTLGLGLGAVARSADVFSLSSEPGRGTVLVARFYAHRDAAFADDGSTAGLTRAIHGEEVCGDAYAVRRSPGRVTLMMCDGSGHGPLAASASREAVRVFCDLPPGRPEEAVARLHEALRGTRGGAVAVADLDWAAGTVRFSGLGNIAAAVLADGRKRNMVSVPGVAGFQARTVRAFDHELPGGAVVVLHSDGLTERWTPQDVPVTRPPLVIAAALLRDAGVRRDDAGVLVAVAP